MSWIVITLKPNQSKKAEENLGNQGFTTFFPRIIQQSNQKLISKDLFSGYAFIALSRWDILNSINCTKGVSRVLKINDFIPKVEDSLIVSIRRQIVNLNSNSRHKESFKKNDRVTIKLKIFNNQEAEVIDVFNKRNNQQVLLKILDSSQTLWINSINLNK